MALGVLGEGALLADRYVAGLAEEPHQLPLVLGAGQWLVSSVGDFIFVLDLGQREDAVALEAVHKLMGLDAVAAEEVSAVKAAGYGSLVGALAAGAA